MRNQRLSITVGVIFMSMTLIFTGVAQQKRSLTPADYGQWEGLTYGELAADGRWLAYGINRTNGQNEMRLRSLSEDKTTPIAFGSEPAFSDDNRWLAYAIGYSEKEQERLTKAKKPGQRKMGLLDLTTRQTTVVENIAAFSFSKGGRFLAMRRYPTKTDPPAPGGEANDAGGEKEPLGVDLVVRDLSSGAETSFGNISNFSWQDNGTMLALTISAEGRAGNGVQLYEPATGRLRTLDSGAFVYTGLTWKKDDDDLSVLRSQKRDGYEEETFAIVAWKDLAVGGEKKILNQPATTGFPAEMRVVRYRQPQWSDDGRAIFIGIKEWTKKVPPETVKGDEADEEPAGVEVWNARDTNIIPEQKLRADRDRQRNYLAIWHLDTNRFVRLAEKPTEEVSIIKGSQKALLRDATPYQADEMFGRPAVDVYTIDLATGERKRIADRLTYVLGASAGGRYILYFKDNQYWTYDLVGGKGTNITESAKTASSFENREDDHPVAQRPPYGVAGWTKSDAAVIVYDRDDLWELRPDGTRPKKLTDGAREEIRHRYLRLDQKEEFIDPAKPLYLSLYGQWTKQSGFARLSPNGTAQRLVWADKGFGRLMRARNAEVFAYVAQSFDDSPDYFVGGADLRDARQVTETNPFQKNYTWGRGELIEYRNKGGERLQGALYYPANYEAGKQYPMIVYIYERLSQNLHSYAIPSERNAYNPAAWTGRGYFVLMPDIVFRPRDPGASIVDCVTAAVNKAIEKGSIDRARLGITGHSWGGYGTAFLATNTDLFAAAAAGAPLTDFVAMYGSVFWNSGQPETSHFEVGQERMQAPLWEDREAYLRNSPIHNAQRMKTPLLMTFGDKDGSVDWHQGISMYNVARRAGKNFVLLVYPGENHGLRQRANQIDYHRRINEWFGHYLQGAPAAEWMTKGVSHLAREAELKRLKERKKEPPKPAPAAGSSGQD